MKKITLSLVMITLALTIIAQSPHAFKYQAVARDNAGNVLDNKNVTFKIVILKDSVNGAVVYREIHDTITNELGLINLEIGNGNAIFGLFEEINWGDGLYFLKIWMDENGGINFLYMGTTQLMSVPYALYAESSGDAGAAEINELTDAKTTGNSLYLGLGAGVSDNSSDNKNVGVGNGSLAINTSGDFNAANGLQTLYYNTTGNRNTANGYRALFSNTIGTRNTATGFQALYYNTEGEWNTAVGSGSLLENTNGNNNTAIGFLASNRNTIGNNNTTIGRSVNYYNQKGSNNTIVGYQAGMGTINHNKSGNVLLGYQAGYNDTTDNKLYIENSNSTTPLIYGEFDNDILAFNANVGIGTENPDESAILDLSSNSKGFLLPRMTKDEIFAIPNPTSGLQVFNITTNCLNYYNGIGWFELCGDYINAPPSQPFNPIPEDGATDQNLDETLAWSCTDPEGGSLTYDVYFGTENPPALVSSGQTENTYDPGILLEYTQYFWKIVSHDDASNSTDGLIWNFTTLSTVSTTSVGLQVNMNYQAQLGNFDPDNSSLDVSGTFNNWEGTQMFDTNGDGIFSVTTGTVNVGSEIEFIFRMNGVLDGTEEFSGTGVIRSYLVLPINDYQQFWYNDQEPIFISCGDIFIDERDGKAYKTVEIGSQCWMAENLNVGTRIDATGNQLDNDIIEKYCYGDAETQCDQQMQGMGGLYQWDEMMQYSTTEGAQGICPTGWHIPTDEEWKQLEGEVDSYYGYPDPVWDNFGERGTDAGSNLLTNLGLVICNSAANTYNFNALPAGLFYGGSFYDKGSDGDFWSSTQIDMSLSIYRWLQCDWWGISRYDFNKTSGLSVRCVKD